MVATTSDLQQRLSPEQIAKFYHDEFVPDQLRDFRELVGPPERRGVVVDIGGGAGYFAESIQSELGAPVRVIDMDPESIARCRERGIPAEIGDALTPPVAGDEGCICFNLILHHLVASDEARTRALQKRALVAWKDREIPIFVNEYIYESFVGTISGRLIFLITSSPILSAIASFAARFIPALRANTFGVGVRFRAHREWLDVFQEAGFVVEGVITGDHEPVRLPLRLLLIKTIRRDSFLLRPAESAGKVLGMAPRPRLKRSAVAPGVDR